jgi:hypothetical protein
MTSSKDRKYKELMNKNTYLLEQNEKLENELKTLKTDSSEMSRKLEINNKHEEIETIFSKLGSLMLATNDTNSNVRNKMEDNLSLRQHEIQLIKELFGSKINDPTVQNTDISIIDVFGRDDMDIANYAQSFINSNSLSCYKSRAKKSCTTQRKKKRTKTRDLTHCKSIDLQSILEKTTVGYDDQTSVLNDNSEGRYGASRKKKPKVNDLLSMMH